MKYILLFLFVFFSCLGFSRNYTGIVIDALKEIPISNVNITVLHKHEGVKTDQYGQFTLACLTRDSIQISHVSYHPVKLKAKELSDTIFLLEKTIELTGVVISANAAKELLKTAISNLHNNLERGINRRYSLFHEDCADNKIVKTCNSEMLLTVKDQKKNKAIKYGWYLLKMISKEMDSLFCASYPWTKDALNLSTNPALKIVTFDKKHEKKMIYEKEVDNDSLIVIHSFPISKYKDDLGESRYYIQKLDTILFKRISDNSYPFDTVLVSSLKKKHPNQFIKRHVFYEFKKSISGYYSDLEEFYVERRFIDTGFTSFSQKLTIKAMSEFPSLYNKKEIPEIKQKKVYASSYLYDFEASND
jgi:ribosome-associated translation inhibitor RaiA